MPVNEVFTDGRPRALQVETGGITVENHTLLSLLKDESFLKAWERVKSGWFPNSQNQFPHSSNDPSILPSNLVELIEAEIMGGVNPSHPNKNTSNISLLHTSSGRDQTRLSAPNITLSSAHSIASTNQINLLMLECWHAHTRCVNLSFVADMSHRATLHTKQFVQDFPFSLWLFQPKKFEEILSAATPSDTPIPSHLPSIYAMVDIASPITLQLEHLQFLFLMRLKDSFQYFKNRIMKYFSIDTLIESQGTQAFQVTRDGSDIDSIDDGESSESTDDIKGKLKAVFARGRERADSKVQGDYVTAGVSLSGLEVSIMLPTLTKINKKRKKGAKQETGPAAQVMNIETAGPGPSPAASSPLFPLEVSFSPPTPSPPDSVPSPLPPSLSQTEVITNGTGPPKDSDGFVYVEPPQNSAHTELPPLLASSSSNVSSDANENTVPDSESTSSSEVPLPHSGATPPDDDVDIPNAPIDTLKPQLLNTANSLKSVSMSSTGGSSLSSFVVPEYILVAKVGVVQGGATISSEGICFKAAVRTVDLNEYKEEEYKLMNDEKLRRKRIKKEGGERDSDVLPVIKARLELGQSVGTYFPKEEGNSKDPESDKGTQSIPEGVIFLKVNGLKPTLALKNTMVMKDFFDDEIESEVPIPLQLRLTETQVSLKDSVPAPLLHPRNLTVNIPDLFVNRGPRARNTNLLTAEGGATPVVGMATPLVIKKSGIATPTVGVATPIVARRQEEGVDDEKLLQSLVDHLKANEGKTHQGNHKLQSLVKEIQGLLETTPTYTDSLSCDFYTNLTSDKPHPTVERLQNEIDTLRKENAELNGSLSRSREDTSNVAEERAEVVKQLVKVQMEHATLQLAHEKQLRQIDRLVTEKGDLQEQLKQLGIS